jgi:hypothetical protein
MDKEFTLKRIEACIKVMDAATERQFKLASFALAGNVGPILACSLAIKNFRAGQPLAPEIATALS